MEKKNKIIWPYIIFATMMLIALGGLGYSMFGSKIKAHYVVHEIVTLKLDSVLVDKGRYYNDYEFFFAGKYRVDYEFRKHKDFYQRSERSITIYNKSADLVASNFFLSSMWESDENALLNHIVQTIDKCQKIKLQ